MNDLRKVRLLLQSDPSWVDRLTMALEIQGEGIGRTPQIEITYALAPQIEVTEPETGLFHFNSDSVSDEELMDAVSDWIEQRNLKLAEEELAEEVVSDVSSTPGIETSPDLSSVLYRIEDSLETIKMAVFNPEVVEEPPVLEVEPPVLEVEPPVLEKESPLFKEV